MKRLVALARDLGQRVAFLFTRRRPHRSITVLGPSWKECCDLVRMALASVNSNSNRLQSESPAAEEIRSGRAGSMETWPAERPELQFGTLFLTDGKKSKLRRWQFRLARWQSSAEERKDDVRKLDADTYIVCWPFSLLGQEPQRSWDLCFHLAAQVGAGRDRGRLKRLAVALTGVPRDLAPRHSCQCRLDPPPHSEFRAGIERALAASAGVPGEGLADPRWRAFLADRLAVDSGLERLVENVRRSLGRSCPLILIPEPGAEFCDLNPLLDWIAGGRAHGRQLAQRHGRRFCLAAAAVLSGVLCAAWNLPSRGGLTAGDVASRPAESLRADIEARVAAYQSPALALVRTGRRAPTSRTHLQQALAALRERTDAERWRAQLDSACTVALDSLRVGNDARRARIAKALAELVVRQSGWRNARPENEAVGASDWGPWVRSLARTAWLASLASLRARDASSLAFASTPEIAASMEPCVARFAGGGQAARLRSILGSAATGDLYAEYARQLREAGPQNRSDLLDMVPALPRPEALRIVREIESLSLETLLHRGSVTMMGLRQIVGLTSLSPADTLLDQQLVERAQQLLAHGQEALRRREMRILFSRKGDATWHLDVSRTPARGYQAARWSNTPGLDGGCAVDIVGLAYGDTLYLSLNGATDVHVVADHGDPPCSPGAPATLVLREKEGTVRFADGRDVQYVVVDGWSEWPPSGN